MPTVIQTQINDSPTDLDNNQDTPLARIQVNQGEPNIMVIGKVVIVNARPETVHARVRLTSQDGSIVLDIAQVNIPSNSSQVVTVIGWITRPDLTPNQIVDMQARASAFGGISALWARLIVIGADVLT